MLETSMVIGLGELSLAQVDGSSPMILTTGAAPGESGISLHCVRFKGGLHLSGTLRQHFICFQSAQACFDCRIGGRTLRHEPPAGSLAICPAGVDCTADANSGLDALFILIDPRHLGLAAAEESALEARLTERLSGHDQELLSIALTLVSESKDNYPNGPLFWNELAGNFLNGVIARHTSGTELHTRGTLGKDVLARLKEYIVAHMGEPIEVAALAKMAGRSPFHFSRVFTRSVGISPHRYIVHLRLQRALELARGGQAGLAEIAVRTGFADQSHLWRWARRVHGVSLSHLATAPASEPQESS
jgi:AraC family transcriptional regulator